MCRCFYSEAKAKRTHKLDRFRTHSSLMCFNFEVMLAPCVVEDVSVAAHALKIEPPQSPYFHRLPTGWPYQKSSSHWLIFENRHICFGFFWFSQRARFSASFLDSARPLKVSCSHFGRRCAVFNRGACANNRQIKRKRFKVQNIKIEDVATAWK